MKMRRWSIDEVETLARLYPDTPNSEIAETLDRRLASVLNKAFKMGLKKSQRYLGQMPKPKGNKATQFKKGQKPWNTGLKLAGTGRVHYRGTWEKGNKTWNTRPIGSMRYNERDGWARKVGEPRDWISYARFVWELHSGRPVPKGHIVKILDGNPHHICMKNLACITRSENAKLNSIHRYPKEYVRLRQMIGQMNRVRNNQERKNNETP